MSVPKLPPQKVGRAAEMIQRTPDPAAPARIQSLATLPVFFKARGRRVIIAGGGDAAAWKAELLAAAGAAVEVFTDNPGEKMLDLAATRKELTLHRRPWSAHDLAGALLAIIDAKDDSEARAFQDAARKSGVVANMIDRPAFCDFQFGSIVNRSPLVVAISTDGAAPVFGQALRARIETLLPAGFAAWAQAARNWRSAATIKDFGFRARRTFWEGFTALALARPNEPPTEADKAALLNEASLPQRAPGQGKVLLVGAGPGDPELLTLRAARALQSADVIVFDDLVSPGVLDMARREATRINVGKRGYKPSCGQDEISALLVELAQSGKTIVRLKGGDPGIFGRANEEMDVLEGAGVPVEIIPGVTAASGAAAALAVSLTERDLARRVQFVTAHARDGRLPEDLNWSALADSKATTAVYMGVRTLPAFVGKLLEAGADPETSAVLIERATHADQRIIAGKLSSIVALVAAAAPSGPCLTLFGAVLAKAEKRADAQKN